jgi:HSP20 family protein
MFMRLDPWREFDRLTEELFATSRVRPGMPMDAYRKGEELVVRFDLPGIAPDSIDVTVEKGVLTVNAERRHEPDEGVEVLFSERPQGNFVRRVLLGDALDVDNLKAHYENGVLTVVIPVAESARPRKVEITEGEKPKALKAETKAA